jgi:hypothetical protein
VSMERCCSSALASLASYDGSSKSRILGAEHKGVCILVRASSSNKNSRGDRQ